jgi:hypothetical protein
MAKYDDFENAHLIVGVTLPTSVATPVTSAAIDTTGYEQLTVICNAGVIAATGAVTLTMTESATLGGSYTANAGATLAFTDAEDGVTKIGKIKCNHVDQLPFKKVVLTPDTAAGDASAVMIASNLSGHYPVAGALVPVFNLSNP